MSNRIDTGVFRMNSFNFITSLLFRYGWVWLLALSALGLCGLVIGLTVDLRWLVVGLMLIFIVIPMLTAFYYYFFALKPECYVNTVNHKLSFKDSGVDSELYFEEEKSRKLTFDYSQFERFQINASSIIIPFKSPMKGYIWVPESAFDNKQEFLELLDFLTLRFNEISTSDVNGSLRET